MELRANAPDRQDFYLISKKSWLPISMIGNIENVISSPEGLNFRLPRSKVTSRKFTKRKFASAVTFMLNCSNVLWSYFLVLSAKRADLFFIIVNRRLYTGRCFLCQTFSLYRQRSIIWFINPPSSKSVKTNIGRNFLTLIDKHFPPHNKHHNIFNRNTVN
jgi:hypothetical protein